MNINLVGFWGTGISNDRTYREPDQMYACLHFHRVLPIWTFNLVGFWG